MLCLLVSPLIRYVRVYFAAEGTHGFTLCSDRPDSSMPLIKFARKLAETATETKSTAEVEEPVMDVEEDEKELVCIR